MIGRSGEKLRQRRRERNTCLFDKRQQAGGRRHWLGDRRQIEDIVGRHRAHAIDRAKRFMNQWMTAATRVNNGAWHRAGFDTLAQHVERARQSLRLDSRMLGRWTAHRFRYPWRISAL